MTEIATESDAPDLPSPPSRRSRAPSGASGAGAIAAAAVCGGLLAGAGWFAWGPARLNGALQDLTSEDPAVLKGAQDRLAASKEAVQLRLPELSGSSNPLQRRRAVRAAGALGLKDDAETLEIVKKASTDTDPLVRRDALDCLKGFANAGSAEALKALLDLASKEGTAASEALVDALGEAAPPSDPGKGMLADRGLELLSAPHPSPRLRAALVRSVGMVLLGKEPSADAERILHGLLASAADPSPEVRSALDSVLRQLQGPRAVPLALGALEHADPWVRLWGETVLRSATGKHAGSDPLGAEAARKAGAEQWKTLTR